MMRNFAYCFYKKLTGIILLLLSPVVLAESSTDDQAIKSEINQFLEQQKIPGAAVLIYHQKKMEAYYFGMVNIHTKKPVTGETIFELGSITKTFTGLLLAEETNAGKLNLTDKVSKLLKNGNDGSSSIQAINLLQLATHSSSLPFNAPNIAYNAKATPKTEATLDKFLQTWKASYPAGTQTLYSNFGFGLLGIALAEQEHQSLAQLMQEKILVPLNMLHSGLHVTNENYAQGYTAEGKPALSPQPGLLGGGWAMKSNANDMQHYLKAALQVDGTPAEIQKAFRLAETPFVIPSTWNSELGLGWVVTPLENIPIDSLLHAPTHYNISPKPTKKIDAPAFISNSLIDKIGATDGFRSYLGILPDKQIGILIMINQYIPNSGALQNEGRKLLFELCQKNTAS